MTEAVNVWGRLVERALPSQFVAPKRHAHTAKGERKAARKRRAIEYANPWNLTPAQALCLTAITECYTVAAVAQALGIKPNTAELHLTHARRKMACETTLEAALWWDRWMRGRSSALDS